MRQASAVVSTLCVAVLGGCSGSLPPLRGQIEVGREPYAVFVAGESPAGGDLYALRAEGGQALPITFTNVGEMRPSLSPDGTSIVFLRGRSLVDSTPATIWVMNLLSGAERDLTLPRGAGLPTQAVWSGAGRTVVVATTNGLYQFGAPPAADDARPVPQERRLAAESSLAVLLGDPPFARVVPCAEEGSLCVATDSGAPDLLARSAHDGLRWGADSVAFFTGAALEIRPLGPGRARRLEWSGAPPHPRQATYFAGSVARQPD